MQPIGKEFVRSELVREQPSFFYIMEIYRETCVCKDESHDEQVFAKAFVIAYALSFDAYSTRRTWPSWSATTARGR